MRQEKEVNSFHTDLVFRRIQIPTSILLQNLAMSALHHQYFKVDYQNIVNQIAQGSDGQYWSCVINLLPGTLLSMN